MKKVHNIGQKIKNFRKRAGLSQLELELEIGAAPGSLSRIESGKVNPTKEAIVDISKVLKLETNEIATLFGIDLADLGQLMEITTEILSIHNLRDVLDKTVNDLVFKMGYIASVIFLIEGDEVFSKAITNSNISANVFKYLSVPFEQLNFSLIKDKQNFVVKAICENKIYLTRYTHKYIVPAVSKSLADKLQEVTGDKSNIIFPLSFGEDKPFGAIVYIKKVLSDFAQERRTLELISKQIAVAVHNARVSAIN